MAILEALRLMKVKDFTKTQKDELKKTLQKRQEELKVALRAVEEGLKLLK